MSMEQDEDGVLGEDATQEKIQTHPLHIRIEWKHTDIQIKLEFFYLVPLETVTVRAAFVGKHATALEHALVNLYPDDAGVEMPFDPARVLAGMHNSALENSTIDTAIVGVPFFWTQSLAGFGVVRSRDAARVFPVGLADVVMRLHARIDAKRAVISELAKLSSTLQLVDGNSARQITDFGPSLSSHIRLCNREAVPILYDMAGSDVYFCLLHENGFQLQLLLVIFANHPEHPPEYSFRIVRPDQKACSSLLYRSRACNLKSIPQPQVNDENDETLERIVGMLNQPASPNGDDLLHKQFSTLQRLFKHYVASYASDAHGNFVRGRDRHLIDFDEMNDMQ